MFTQKKILFYVTCASNYFEQSLLNQYVLTQEERNFVCNTCQKNFKVESDYVRHNFSHNVVRKFTCNVCHKVFDNKNSLRKHILSHSKGKTHEFPTCGKLFTEKEIRCHIRVHT